MISPHHNFAALKSRVAVRDAIWLAVLCTILLAAAAARADEPKVTAVLSRSQTDLGRPVELQIKVTGSSGAKAPDITGIDGLDIRYSGQSQMIEGHNLRFSYSFVYSYTVMPERTGTFRIPSQKIQAGSNSLQTPELTLRVVDSSAGPAATAQSGRSNDEVDTSRLGFVELLLTKSTAYVGEMVPAEVRIGFNARTPVESLGGGINITGQGFTTQTIPDTRPTIETIKGRTYQVFNFKTAIAPARSGKIEIGPVEIHPVVRIPRPIQSQMGQRDLFDMNDPFFQSFFNDPAFAPSVSREITLQSKPVSLDVKALPPNAPPEFSGAIGVFSLETDAKPKTGQIGDPVTVTTKISGRGNFDRVNAPELSDERGWHKYPPSSSFKQDDDVGVSGEKTFETVLTPNESKKSIPPVVFSFFDPMSEKYVSLRSDPIPVQIEGGTAPSPAAATPAQAPNGTPAPAAKAEDILYQMSDWPAASKSFTPVYTRPNFWLAQIIPLIALLGFLGWKWRQSRLSDREARRRAALQQEAAELQRRLRKPDVSPSEYYAGAARAVQVKTALARNVNPNAVDANAAAAAFHLDEARRSQLHTLFQKKDELRYSGNQNGKGVVPSEQQKEVLDLIENLRP